MNTPRTGIVGALALSAMLFVSAATAAPDFASLKLIAYSPPKPAPSFALPNLTGQTVSLAGLKGRVVLVFFWATW